jgi:diguanylate cyclase (GGDEF)-like protein/PAS domain S-box-containing protein
MYSQTIADRTARLAALTSAESTTLASLEPPSRQQEYGRVLQKLIGNTDGLVYRCHVDDERTIEFASPGFLRLTGRTPAELLAGAPVSLESITYPEDRLWVREVLRAALAENRAFDLEYRIVHRDASVRWVWERGIGVKDGSGSIVAIEGLLQDMSARRQALLALHEAESRFRDLFENAIEGIFRTSVGGEYLDANAALARIYGYETGAELIASIRDIAGQLYVDPARREEFGRIMRANGEVGAFESEVRRRDGSVIWISENARALRDPAGNVLLYEGTVEDITDRKRYQAQLEYLATHDTLTGLANRSLLIDRLTQAIHSAASHGEGLAVVLVDLDHFKVINDTLGHHVGDELLRDVAERLASCGRDYDTVARLGGDEFVLLLNGHGQADSLGRTLERILSVVAQPWSREGHEFSLSCSLGVALYPQDGSDPQTLLKYADSALYRAKESGRNNFQFFTSELTVRMTQRLDMESKLRRALECGQFELHYQPRFDAASARLVGAEALPRCRLPGEGLLMPDRILVLGEETGLIIPLGAWMMRTACEQLQAWLRQGMGLGRVSVNVSLRQFQHGDLVRTVDQLLRETRLAPQRLELALPESIMMLDGPKVRGVLEELRGLGVSIAIDDFGVGLSSLAQLKRLPLDRLKIDPGFLSGIPARAADAALLRSIITLGHALGLQVLAKGVETRAQLDFLRTGGCDAVSGCHLGRPMAEPQFRSLIREELERTL